MTSRVALITFMDSGGPGVDNTLPSQPVYPSGGPVWPGGPVDPGYGRPGIGGGHPDAGLPWAPGHPSTGFPPVYPGHALPPGARLPIYPFDPTKPVPPEGPSTKPIEPGDEFRLKCTVFGLILVRVKLGSGETLPETPAPTPTTT